FPTRRSSDLQPHNRSARAYWQDRWSLHCACRLESLPSDREVRSLCASCSSGLHDLHLFSSDDGIWRIYNHRFIALETRNNLYLIAEIATRRYRCEQHAAVFYNCDLQTLRGKSRLSKLDSAS